MVGGLGNQLFIWSATNYFADKFEKPPAFEIVDHRKFVLGEILRNDVTSVQKSRVCALLSNWIVKVSRLGGFFQPGCNAIFGIFVQNEIGYSEDEQPTRKTSYLVGYFQSHRYLKAETKESIRMELDLSLVSENSIQALNNFIQSGGIGIHIRLGDYLKPENEYFGILDPAYYMNSLKDLGVASGSTIWVFTDSPEIAREIYAKSLESVYKIIWPSQLYKATSIEEFKLLANSKKIVIANSTFSWWAAYLSDAGTNVRYPSNWFRYANNPKELAPTNWSPIDSVWLKHRIGE